MGVETELLGLKNRYDGKEFRVIEREDGTIAVLAGDTVIVDSGVLPVTAIPSSGGVEFDAATRAAIRKQVVPSMDPFYDARPQSLVPVNTIAMRAYAHDGTHLYGVALANYSAIYRQLPTDANPTSMYTWPSSHTVYSVYCELGAVFAVIRETATDLYTLWRSTDGGVTFAESVKIGIGADGTHYPGAPFIRGLCSGRLSDGRSVVICTTYNTDQVNTTVLPKDRRYAIISYDRGATWSLLWELNVGVKNIRHFHAAQIDAQGRVIIMLGDGDDECATIVAHDITRWSFPNNVTPAQLKSYAGFSVATGKQNCRAVDGVVVTDDDGSQRLLTYTDTASDGLGGIWSWDYPSMTNPTRVAHPNFGQQHDGWIMCRHSGGTIYACDATLSGPNMYLNVSGSADGGIHWTAVGRYYLPGNGSISSLFELPDGTLGIAAGAGAGPAGARVTHIYELREKVLDDDIETILAPVCYVRQGGNDSNDGTTPALAVATLKGAVNTSKIPAKCRVVIQGPSGPGSAAFISSARWGGLLVNTTNNTADTSIYFHVSGDGADKTIVEITGSGGISGLGTAGWGMRLDRLKIYRASVSELLLVDNAAQTGAAKWVATDAEIGDATAYARYTLYMQTATFSARRCKFVGKDGGLLSDALYAKDTAVVDIRASVFVGGTLRQYAAANVSLLHVTADRTGGYIIDVSATVAPTIKNSNFGEGSTVAAIVNWASVSLGGSVSGNYFPTIGGGANIPAQALPVGGATWMSAGYRPRPGSPLLGGASPVGVIHDYYGAAFLTTPAVGAVQG